MKPLLTVRLTLIALLLLSLGGINRAGADNILSVAVFDFESTDEAVKDLGPKIATLVSANLSAEPQLILVERTELAKALGEQEMGLSGTVSTESAAKVGQLTGAKVLVTGRVFKADEQTIVVAKIIGTETSRVYGEMVTGKPGAGITDLAADLAHKIAADVTQKGDTLVAKVESPEDRITRLKALVTGKTLPVVSVKINEQHYGPHIIDPAAETEIVNLLQKCGFQIADANSTIKPTVEITGDAFSAYGAQKGNLISCKSRVEIKIRDIASGNILLEDRQTSVGVDIAEQTAAKTALQNAADVLVGRIIPALTKP